MTDLDLPPWYHRYKPAAGAAVHRKAAALLWTVVGLGLGTAGSVWLLSSSAGFERAGLAALALAVGWAKGVFVLRRTARRALARIERRGSGHCLGGFLSWRSWLLVGFFMTLGRVLRSSGLPRPLLGTLYVAVGVALLLGSAPLWRGTSRLGDRLSKTRPS